MPQTLELGRRNYVRTSLDHVCRLDHKRHIDCRHCRGKTWSSSASASHYRIAPRRAGRWSDALVSFQAIVAVVATIIVCLVKKRNEDLAMRKRELKEKRDKKKAEIAKAKRDADEKVRAADHPWCIRCSM